MNALAYRAKTVGAISENQAKYLFALLAKRGYRTREPAVLDLRPENPRLFQELIDFYFSELGYTIEEFCKGLSISENDFRKYYAKVKPNIARVV